MPSPFPGMDPYLEGSLWMTVHSQLGVEIARQLAPRLRPRYIALTTERFVMEEPGSVGIATAAYPDVGVIPRSRDPDAVSEGRPGGAPLTLATEMPSAVPHVSVEIRDTAKRRLVAAIEVLSPTNKRGSGREEYLAKRRRILLSSAHLLEIDLLREGRRVPMRGELPPAPWFVFLSRADRRPWTEIWPIDLADPLPTVPVPLLEGDADAELDLQAALATVYDAVGYDLAVDYSSPPEVPFEQDDARTWVAKTAVRAARASTEEG